MVKYIAIIVIMLGGFYADYQSKCWAKNTLKDKPVITVIKNMMEFGFTENRGVVFGIFNGKMSKHSTTLMMVFRTVILIGLMIFMGLMRKKSFFFLLPFALFWAGAIGNLIDSLLYGYVVDFIHIHCGTILDWPFYFNLADAYITIGIALLLITEVVPKRKHTGRITPA